MCIVSTWAFEDRSTFDAILDDCAFFCRDDRGHVGIAWLPTVE